MDTAQNKEIEIGIKCEKIFTGTANPRRAGTPELSGIAMV